MVKKTILPMPHDTVELVLRPPGSTSITFDQVQNVCCPEKNVFGRGNCFQGNLNRHVCQLTQQVQGV